MLFIDSEISDQLIASPSVDNVYILEPTTERLQLNKKKIKTERKFETNLEVDVIKTMK